MGKVILKDFEVLACHGVNAEEKIVPQRFLITVELTLDVAPAAKEDDLTKTVSYAKVKKLVKRFTEENTFDLIETLADRLAQNILNEFAVADGAEVTVKKPDAPMSGVFDYAAVKTKRVWKRAYLSLGSSEGDRQGYLDFAVRELKRTCGVRNVIESSRIFTRPYGGVAKGEFLNSAVGLDTYFSAYELLDLISQIESNGGRVRLERWGDRTLDIDILLFGGDVFEDSRLCVPHPDMCNRAFVLEPLNEIAPYAVHPLKGKRIFELLADFSNNC